MARFILVMTSDEQPTQWIAVAIADSAAALKALTCYDRNDPRALSKASYPGVKVCDVVIPNCASQEIPETGTIYALNGL